MNRKRLLTLDDLASFCLKNKVYNFDSNKDGYSISVQIPSQFDEIEDTDDSILYANVRLFHTGENRNKSSVSMDAARKSLSGIKYKPILANFTDDTPDGLKDFTSHDMEIDDDGKIIYIEHQVGCFTIDDPYIQYDKELKKNYVFAKIAIPRQYTDAAEIIERKKGTKISVELGINEFTYNTKDKLLELTDIEVQGATLLGYDPKRKKYVSEGMEGASVSLEDFSQENNSIMQYANSTENQLINTLEKLNETLSQCFNKQAQKGGTAEMGMFEELLKKYNKTESDINFDHENMSDEELIEAFKEAFEDAETPDEPDVQDEPSDSEGEDPSDNDEKGDTSEVTVTEPEPEPKPEDDHEDEHEEVTLSEDEPKRIITHSEGKTMITYELSDNDIRNKINRLVNKLETDGIWYDLVCVYPNRFILHVWKDDTYYGCNYIMQDDEISLDGDLYRVYPMFLTEDEKTEIETMRASFSELQDKVNSYESQELTSKKNDILNSTYSEYTNEPEFKELVKNMSNYSLEQFNDKAKIAFAECVQRKNVKKVPMVRSFNFNKESKNSKKKPYGNIFK